MTEQQAERYTELQVVERESHVTGETAKTFACAVKGEGTYYFSILSLHDPMSYHPPKLDLERSDGCLRVERGGELLWESTGIVNRGGGMGNEWNPVLLGVPDEFIEKIPEEVLSQHPHLKQPNDGSSKILRANDFKDVSSPFQVDDIVKLRNPADLLDAIEIQLHSQWERHKMSISHSQADIDDPVQAREFDIEVFGKEDARSEEEIVTEARDSIADKLDEFSFEPIGA